jgi:hypothetical protein
MWKGEKAGSVEAKLKKCGKLTHHRKLPHSTTATPTTTPPAPLFSTRKTLRLVTWSCVAARDLLVFLAMTLPLHHQATLSASPHEHEPVVLRLVA